MNQEKLVPIYERSVALPSFYVLQELTKDEVEDLLSFYEFLYKNTGGDLSFDKFKIWGVEV